MKREHYIIIAVALVAAYFLFFRKKESKVDAVLIPPASPRPPVVPIASSSSNAALAVIPEPMLVPQSTALLFNREAPESRVVSGLTITNGGSSQSRVFGNRTDAKKYYYNRGGAGACSFVELPGGQFEVACP